MRVSLISSLCSDISFLIIGGKFWWKWNLLQKLSHCISCSLLSEVTLIMVPCCIGDIFGIFLFSLISWKHFIKRTLSDYLGRVSFLFNKMVRTGIDFGVLSHILCPLYLYIALIFYEFNLQWCSWPTLWVNIWKENDKITFHNNQ